MTRPMPAPKFATVRDFSRPTLGRMQGEFARIWTRKSFMPHQQYIADVAGELGPDGLPVHKLVVCTMQRQAGKSHLALAQTGERAFSNPGYRAWYTAQTGGDARDQFLKFHEELVKPTPLAGVVETLTGNGRELMRFPGGSTLRPFPPTETAMHGKQSDRTDIDEAWAFEKLEGDALLQAIGPTQLTRAGAQLFIWSAGGTADSTWLAELVARGRAGDPDLAYFEWGIPDDADPEDLDVIAEHHPAYGHTITRESLAGLRTLFKNDPAGWARAAGNRWTEAIGGAIDAETWKAARWPDPIPDAAPLAYGAARAADGSEVVVAAAARVDDVIVVEVLAVITPAYRAAGDVDGWTAGGDLVVDPIGPSAGLHADLVKLEREPLPVNTGSITTATANVLDGLKAGKIKFRQHPALDDAQRVAGTRYIGDGGKAWARRSAGASIAALEAATLAAFALDYTPPAEPESKPVLDFA